MKKTPLHEYHKNLGAKLVDFAGFEMPIQYHSIIDEHLFVRKSCGVFDVSHMGEFIVTGKKAAEFLNRITINDVTSLKIWQAQYSAMCNEDGGIIDDILIYRYPDHYMLVVNCSNIEKNFDWIVAHKPNDIFIANLSEKIGLIAVQGPKSLKILDKLVDIDLNEMKYYHFSIAKIKGSPATISRTGYTGELGYEIYADNNSIIQIWNEIFKYPNDEILPAGLGCRDTLRLEMKYVLYGNDIDHKTNPIEAGLSWITKLNKESFIGRESLEKYKNAQQRKLVCIEMIDKGIPRRGYEIFCDDEKVGSVTSGSQSPSLQKGIGLAYLNINKANIESELDILVRNKKLKCRVVKPPFYKNGSVLD